MPEDKKFLERLQEKMSSVADLIDMNNQYLLSSEYNDSDINVNKKSERKHRFLIATYPIK